MGQTAMHVAALWGNQEAIKVLLANGADVNCTNSRCADAAGLSCTLASVTCCVAHSLVPFLPVEA
jgi:ankyrin repeat protein